MCDSTRRFWICDSCGLRIDNPAEGWIEWILVGVNPRRMLGPRIVHRNRTRLAPGCQADEPNLPVGHTIGDESLELVLTERRAMQGIRNLYLDGSCTQPHIERFLQRVRSGDS